MDETMYEFKENDESAQSRDDIDAFEHRLTHGSGGSQRASKPAPTVHKATAAAAVRPGAQKPGSHYVNNAAKSAKPLTEEAGEKEEDKRAVSDLDKFDAMHRLDDDDD